MGERDQLTIKNPHYAGFLLSSFSRLIVSGKPVLAPELHFCMLEAMRNRSFAAPEQAIAPLSR